MIFKTTRAMWEANTREDIRTFVNQGGTSSGKTYAILQVLLYHAIKEDGAIITICGQDLPNLKVGAFRDCKNIINASPWLAEFFRVYEGGHYIQGKNGSILEFNSYDDAQDAKNGKRDYLFVNEANGVDYDIFWQLQIRTRKKVFIDYNPTARFWAHDEVIGRKGVALVISDHRHNPFLSAEEHERIEGISDPELWRVYARGKTGKVSGLVLPNYDIVDQLPERDAWKVSCYGLDWGFTNDPTALVFFCLAHGDLWVDELIYSTGMTNADIGKRMGELGLTRRDMVVADSAEEKSIAEVRHMGFYVIPSVKGRDSVVNGLDIMRRYKIHVTRRSRNVLEELGRYTWERRDGHDTNVPIDRFNHAIDALRYAVSMKLKQRPTGINKGHNIFV